MHRSIIFLTVNFILLFSTITFANNGYSESHKAMFEACQSFDINSGTEHVIPLNSKENISKRSTLIATDVIYEFTAETCLTFKNTSNEKIDFSMWFDNPRAHHIEMTSTEDGLLSIIAVKGIDYPLQLWKTSGAEIVFDQSLGPNEEKTLYFNAGSIPPYNTQIIIADPGILAGKIAATRMTVALLAGIILTLVTTCIAIGISARDRAYFLISGSTIFVTLLQLSDLGSLLLLWPNSMHWNSICSGVFASFSTFFGAILARVYLETKINTPRIDKILLFYIWYLVVICMPTAMLENDKLFLVVFGGFSVIFFMPAIVAASIIRINQGFSPAKLYLAALVMPYISGLCIFFMYTGALPSSPLMKTLPLAGTALQLIIFVVALGARINWLQGQKNIAIKSEFMSRTETLAKRTFLAHISHELRSPLAGIIGLTELAVKHPLYPTNKTLIDGISRSAKFLLDTINTLLDHARIDSGKWEIKTSSFNPEQLLHLSIDKFHAQAKEKNLTLKLNAYQSPFANIEADQDIVARVVDEMIRNAIMIAGQGSILVNAGLTQAGREALVWNIETVCVGDASLNPAELVPFELFDMADSSTTREQQGPGLGLSLSKKLCALIGGTIGLDSSVLHRTAICCSIPCKPTIQANIDSIAPPSTSKEHTLPRGSRGTRVLMAEDDETLRLVMMPMLDKLHADYTLYPNGKPLVDEYLHAYANIGLVVLDWNMPVCNASQAIQAIRDFEKQSGISPVTIVILSALDRSSARELQIPDDIQMIQKPITLQDLRKILPGTVS